MWREERREVGEGMRRGVEVGEDDRKEGGVKEVRKV